MIYVHLAEGFEELEAITIVDLLRRAELEVQTVSITGEKKVKGTHGVLIEADILFEEADYEGCSMIVLPGGMPGALNLQEHEGLGAYIKSFADSDKKLAAICAAPMVLEANKAIINRSVTIYPGMESKITSGTCISAGTIQDRNIITGKGPAFAIDFALAIIEDMSGRKKSDEVAAGLLYERD